MTSFEASAFLAALPFTVLAVVALFAVTFVAAMVKRKHAIIDMIWGLGFATVAVVSFALSTGSGDGGRRALITAMTVIWGLRLAIHIGWRARGAGEDPRYEDLMARAPGNPALYAL